MTVRIRTLVMVAALLFTSAGAMAQDQIADKNTTVQPDVPKTTTPSIADIGFVNEIEFGLRGTSFSSDTVDRARFQRYQDLRDGGALNRFRFEKGTSEYALNLQADHVGYRDQRFFGAFDNFGKLKASFEWNQVP